MARLLIERETIYQDEVDLIMEGKDVKEIMAYMDQRDKERAENPFKRAEEFANAKAKESIKPAAAPAAPAAPDAPTAPDATSAGNETTGDAPAMPTVGDKEDRGDKQE